MNTDAFHGLHGEREVGANSDNIVAVLFSFTAIVFKPFSPLLHQQSHVSKTASDEHRSLLWE